jgi:hypothetical protein
VNVSTEHKPSVINCTVRQACGPKRLSICPLCIQCIVSDQTEKHLKGSARQPSPDQRSFLFRPNPELVLELWIADLSNQEIPDRSLQFSVG